jgi:hypothetical protein
MARGWESKSVEDQIDAAADRRRKPSSRKAPAPEALELIRQKERESLLLSRTRVVREIEASQNPRYKALLSKALADLEKKLSNIPAERSFTA